MIKKSFQFIRHRVNKISDLKTVNPQHGVEIDLRSNVQVSGSIYLSHDAWVFGDSLQDWFNELNALKIKGPIIFNTKEDGLESAIFAQVAESNIQNPFFFLDTQLPTLIQKIKAGQGKSFAIRVSQFESIEFALQFKEAIQWIWLDCFFGQPIELNVVEKLAQYFKICLVSPELQKAPLSEVNQFKKLLPYVDAICTKQPEAWL